MTPATPSRDTPRYHHHYRSSTDFQYSDRVPGDGVYLASLSLGGEIMFPLRSLQLRSSLQKGYSFCTTSHIPKVTNESRIVFAGKENIDQSPWKMSFLAKLVSIAL